MKNKLIKSLLVISSAFLITSCGDSKDKVVDDMADLIVKQAEAAREGDADKMSELQDESKELMERAREVGIEPGNPSTLTDEQQKKLAEAAQKAMNETMDKVKDELNNALDK